MGWSLGLVIVALYMYDDVRCNASWGQKQCSLRELDSQDGLHGYLAVSRATRMVEESTCVRETRNGARLTCRSSCNVQPAARSDGPPRSRTSSSRCLRVSTVLATPPPPPPPPHQQPDLSKHPAPNPTHLNNTSLNPSMISLSSVLEYLLLGSAIAARRNASYASRPAWIALCERRWSPAAVPGSGGGAGPGPEAPAGQVVSEVLCPLLPLPLE
jgi:hypothetical protein